MILDWAEDSILYIEQLFDNYVARGDITLMDAANNSIGGGDDTDNQTLGGGPSRFSLPLPANRRGVEIKNIRLFFGNVGDDFLEWVGIFERTAVANEWSTAEMARLLPAFLRGEAARKWDSFPSCLQKEYYTIRERLEDALVSKEVTNQYSLQLRTRLQKTGETVEQYARDIEVF